MGYWLNSENGEILNTLGERTEVSSFDLHYGANLISYTCDAAGSLNGIIGDGEFVSSVIGEGLASTYNPSLGWVGSLNGLTPCV
jgi:hypothetical protein